MAAYYNEFDPFAAAWLRELIREGLIADGEVDTRSVVDVAGEDLRGFTQVHLFAGIGGWSYALRLAGWPDDRPVWTGSCPCQPFSAAGQRRGFDDPRHLWPQFKRLIGENRPPVVFGEQVASKDGRLWLAGVRADLEALAYGVGAADLCAAGVGAPHIRQRLFWLADAHGGVAGNGNLQSGGEHRLESQDGGAGERVDDTANPRRTGARLSGETTASRDEARLLEPSGSGTFGGLGNALRATEERQRRFGISLESEQEARRSRHATHWAADELIQCSDGKARRVAPGIFPLAHGIPNRVGTLRGAGNAIVPQVAAEFIKAYLEATAT